MTLGMWRYDGERWTSEYRQLAETHGWRVRPGNSMFVADRGAAMFEYPANWVITHDDKAEWIRISDVEPPRERMRIDVSIMRFPPNLSTEATLEDMIADLADSGVGRQIISLGGIREGRRRGFELAWVEGDFIDSDENRKAHVRFCLARRGNLYAYITSDFYPEVAKPATKAWKGMLATLRVGERITDPSLRFVNN